MVDSVFLAVTTGDVKARGYILLYSLDIMLFTVYSKPQHFANSGEIQVVK